MSVVEMVAADFLSLSFIPIVSLSTATRSPFPNGEGFAFSASLTDRLDRILRVLKFTECASDRKSQLAVG